MDIMTAHQVACGEAKAEAKVLESMHGDGYPCGFAWVTSYVKGNTKEGKALKAAGFKKSYSGGGYQLWNPSGSYVQNVDIKEAAAQKYVDIFGKLTGIKLYVNSRLD
tara:strand:+ start:3893 stop:4213 length:321 start_codon:yes stop_codon:yes gene_type:complete